ncbi:MAG: ferrous iron transport protein A [Verrucomicrobiae bacterium]|nr:ferrous iron transport protein A [Verrucomicrobiae bacterium]
METRNFDVVVFCDELKKSWLRRIIEKLKSGLKMTVVGTPLTRMAVGSKLVVAGIDLPSETRDRLYELGLVAGTQVELVRFAPLGDPVEVKVRGYRLTIPRHEADHILVTPLDLFHNK